MTTTFSVCQCIVSWQTLVLAADLVDDQVVGRHLDPLEAEAAVPPVLTEVTVHRVELGNTTQLLFCIFYFRFLFVIRIQFRLQSTC